MKKPYVSYERTGRKHRERVVLTETGHHMEDKHGNYNPPTEEMRSLLTLRNHFITDVDGYVIICEHSTEERAAAHRQYDIACLRDEQDAIMQAAERQFPGYIASRMFDAKLNDDDRALMTGLGIAV
jgi:hypothetical protein